MGVAHGAWIKGVSAGGSGNSQVDEGLMITCFNIDPSEF